MVWLWLCGAVWRPELKGHGMLFCRVKAQFLCTAPDTLWATQWVPISSTLFVFVRLLPQSRADVERAISELNSTDPVFKERKMGNPRSGRPVEPSVIVVAHILQRLCYQ